MERTPLTHHVLELPGLQKHGRSNKTLTGKRPVPNTSRNCKVVLTIKFSIGKVEWLARQRREIEGGVAEMAKLTANQQWAVGDSFGLGDIAVGTALGYLTVRFAELNRRASYPDLVRFSKRLETRPSFKNSVPYAQTITDKVM